MSMHKPDIKLSAIIVVTIVSVIFCGYLDPIAQDPGYHLFADNRMFLSVPNFFNISSNAFFVLVGTTACYLLIIRRPLSINNNLYIHYLIFFSGILFIGLASGYYHYSPDNGSLLIDRIFIAITFMTFFSIIVAEYITPKHTFIMMPLLIIIGVASTIYWYATELQGAGDLRWYGLVQFLPLLLIAMILVLYRSPHNDKFYIGLILIFYMIAKLFEMNDTRIYELTGSISGHSVKHILAGTAPAILLYSLYKRSA